MVIRGLIPKLGIQQSGQIAADAHEKGPPKGDQPHIVGQEIKAQGQQGVNADDRNHPLPVHARHNQGQQQTDHR